MYPLGSGLVFIIWYVGPQVVGWLVGAVIALIFLIAPRPLDANCWGASVVAAPIGAWIGFWSLAYLVAPIIDSVVNAQGSSSHPILIWLVTAFGSSLSGALVVCGVPAWFRYRERKQYRYLKQLEDVEAARKTNSMGSP